jgi:GDP-L-fucose synthase
METILVTGGTGLVGSAIKIISDNYKHKKPIRFIFLSSKDCDLTCYDKTFQTFDLYKPDYVIHLAANVGGLFKNWFIASSLLSKLYVITSKLFLINLAKIFQE